MSKRKVVEIDLSELFPDESDPTVEVTPADETAVLTYTPPTHLTLSLRDVVCSKCGSITRETLGIFREYHFDGVMRLERISNRTSLDQYGHLPRRVDYAPPESVAACADCWFTDSLIRAAQPPGETTVLYAPPARATAVCEGHCTEAPEARAKEDAVGPSHDTDPNEIIEVIL